MKITTLNPKKYKLIKTYPGSPNLGYEIDLSKIKVETIEGFNNVLTGKWRIFKSTIPNNPEYWQEITNIPEYVKCIKLVNGNIYPKIGQIIKADHNGNLIGICMYQSITYNACFIPSTKEEHDTQFRDYDIMSYLLDGVEVINSMNWSYNKIKEMYPRRIIISIRSIKRLSDGEVFTVGDNCEFGSITRIFITDLGYCMTSTATQSYSCNILYLRKAKQPLFKTEDGVDIFEENETFYVNKDYEIHNNPPFSSRSKKFHGKYFSTKQAAENYIICNKPCLSLSDILPIITQQCSTKLSTYGLFIKRDLKALIKTKL